MVIASVLLVVIAFVTLVAGWLGGIDPLIYVSIAASVLAGIGLSVLGMIAAAFRHLSPVQGALLQELIDVAVILNALRALRIVPGQTVEVAGSPADATTRRSPGRNPLPRSSKGSFR